MFAPHTWYYTVSIAIVHEYLGIFSFWLLSTHFLICLFPCPFSPYSFCPYLFSPYSLHPSISQVHLSSLIICLPFLLQLSFIPHLTIFTCLPSPLSPPGSPVVMAVPQETTYRRRVCVRTVILCVNSVWDLDPATVPPVETQGNVL